MSSPPQTPRTNHRVLLVMDLIPRGRRTWEAWLLDLARTLTARGSQLCLLLPEAGPEWFKEEIEAAGGSVTWNPALRGKFDKAVVLKAVQDLQPTTMVVGFYPMLSSTVLSTVKSGPVQRAFYIDQSSLEIPNRTGWKGLATRLRGRLFSMRYDKVITVSEFKADRLTSRLGIPKGRLSRIYNGVPLSRFQTPPAAHEMRDAIVYAGQMASYKGVTTLLAAYRLLAERWPGCPSLEFAGEGPLKEPLMQEVRDSPLSAKVSFLGQRQDVPELMMSGRCVAIPSEWDEACAFSALEAMASGKPVITSDAGSLPELMGPDGIVFKKKDIPGLVGALEKVLRGEPGTDSAAAATRLRQRAFAHFTLERMTREYADLLAPAE